ncbi:MAG: hypothetical protein U0234_04275 [Sandaracinus sp.]
MSASALRGAPARLVGLALLVLTASPASVAQADEPPEVPARVVLRVPACDGADALPWSADFVELLRLELALDGVDDLVAVTADDTAPGEHVARIEIVAPDCGADQRLEVRIDDVLTHKRVTRALEVADIEAELRPRALALFVVELLRASWAELVLPTGPRPTVPVPRAILAAVRARETESAPASDAPPPPVAGEASALVLAFPSASTALVGGSLGIVLALGEAPLVLRVDGGAAAGESLDRLGRVELGVAGGGVGLALAGRFGPLAVDVGPRLGVGVGWARGAPSRVGASASAGESAVVTLGLAVALRLRLFEGLGARLAIEAGVPVLGLEATVDGVAVAGVHGAMVGVQAGLTLE